MMLGEDGEADDSRSFGSKSVSWRILVISAGAIMNFALALLISTIMALFTASSDTTIRAFSSTVTPSPIEAAGVQIGDRIVRINNQNVNIYGDFFLEMQRADGSPINIEVERDGARHNFTVMPHLHNDGYILGFHPGSMVGPFFAQTQVAADGTVINVDAQTWVHRMGFFESIGAGLRSMVFNIRLIIFSLGQLFTGNLSVDGMMGPVGIVGAVGEQIGGSAAAGGGLAALWAALSFAALISANLGVFNLLPIPALDGGRLVFLFLEAIRRKPISPDKEGMVHFAGFVLLIGLLVFITYNDIVRLL